jgi:hypothetical protein
LQWDPEQAIDGSIQKYPLGFFCQTVPVSGGEEKIGEGISGWLRIDLRPVDSVDLILEREREL